jgi:membrane protein YdbS with pleckstrin-like domain
MRTVLGDDEKILYKTRKHLLYLIGMLGVVCGITYVAILLFKAKFLLLGAIFLIWYFFMEWKNNIWVITNKRLIDEWGVFTKSLKETPLGKINNVSYKKDLLGMVFNYGTIYVQSAAEDGTTVMKMIPSPEEFLRKISEAQNAFISSTLMECPVCKEIIKKGAIKCRFCGSDLREFYEMDEMDYDKGNKEDKENKKEVLEGQKFQEEIKVENFSDNTFFDSPPTVEKDIYKRKVNFVDREGGER